MCFSTVEMAGGVGVPPGLHQGGLGYFGQEAVCFSRMSAGMERLTQSDENVENDQINIEKYVKELTSVCKELFKATGVMFEQDPVRVTPMITA